MQVPTRLKGATGLMQDLLELIRRESPIEIQPQLQRLHWPSVRPMAPPGVIDDGRLIGDGVRNRDPALEGLQLQGAQTDLGDVAKAVAYPAELTDPQGPIGLN